MRRYRVLYVCIGNACRSQMAEAFTRAYGGDVLIAKSGGLQHCDMVAPATKQLMLEKGIDLDGCVPKGIDPAELEDFDLIVNMSGWRFPWNPPVPVREWKVEDPIWLSEEQHRKIRDQIESLVRDLIGEFRGRRLSK